MRVTRWRNHTWVVCLATLLAVMAGYSPPAQAQDRVYLEAYDRQTGATVTDLQMAEVLLQEAGQARRVLDVRLANLPVKLVLVVDNSPAAVRAFDLMKEGLTAFIDLLSPGQEISVLTLAPEPRWIAQGALDREEVLAAIDGMTISRGDPGRLIDAFGEASAWLATDSRLQRPVMVVVATDGDDMSRDPVTKFETVVERVRREGVTTHAIIMSTPVTGSPERRMTPPEALGRALSDLTGGFYATVFLGSGLEDRLGDIALMIRARNRELSRQHLIRFDRPAGAEPGDLRVNITRFGARYSVTMDGRPRSGAGRTGAR